IEGPIAVNACMDQHMGCEQLPRCSMVNVWSEVQRKVTEVFTSTTIADLKRKPCRDLISGSASLSSAARQLGMPFSPLDGRLRLIGRWFYELRDWIEHGGKSHFVVSTRHASAGAISGYFPEKVAFGAGKKAHAGGVGGCDCVLSEVRFCSRG